MDESLCCPYCGQGVADEPLLPKACASCGQPFPVGFPFDEWDDEPLSPGRQLDGHACPWCGTTDLAAHGASFVDDRPEWRCMGCGRGLGAIRPLLVRSLYLGLAALVLTAVWGVAVFILPGTLTRLAGDALRLDVVAILALPGVLLLSLVGMVLPHFGVAILLADLWKPRPRCLPPAA